MYIIVGGIGGGKAVGGGTTVSAVAVIPCGKALKLTAEFGTGCATMADCDCVVTVVVCGCVYTIDAPVEAYTDSYVKGAWTSANTVCVCGTCK